MIQIKKLLTVAVVSSFLGAGSVSAATKVDAKITDYKTVSGVSGNLSSVGSDTLANLMTLWAEDFKRKYPNVNIQVQAAGSSTAPPALTESTSNLGPMSRKMKSKEIAAFEKRYGYKPTAIAVAIDALAVYVNKDNPVKGMSIPQIDAIFSATRKCGHSSDVKKWGDIGLVGSWKGKSIQIFGRNSVSGTYGYFKKKALCKGDYKNNVNEQPGSASVVQSVTASLNGIGYSGIGYKTSGVKAVPLTKKPGQKFIAATPDNAINGTYPLARFLYVYVNKKPNKPLAPLEREFIKLIMSKQGQQVVVKDGYIPLPFKVVQKQLVKIK
ncbi:MAG: PstS family phosphate ABC transporter substrate-binding protein [Gammaproteobacteria bacterium]